MIENKFFYPIITLLLAFSCVSYFYLDRSFAYWMLSLESPNLDFIFGHITELGKSIYALTIFGGTYLLSRFVFRYQKLTDACLFVCSSVLLSGIICDIFKFILGRNRPYLFFTQHLYGFHFFKTQALMLSFPSGHATTIGALMMCCYYLKPKYWPLFLGVALLVAFSRLFLTAHFLSDVVVGLCLGAICVKIWHDFLKKEHYL